MRINTNVAALNSYNQLNNTNNKLSKSLERLSSGKRINGAADDAAGLAISEKMNAQTRGLAQAQRNAQDGISMIQTAEGALKESHSILQRMRELSVQSANDTNTSEDRVEIQKEVDELASELTRISNNTEFNTQTLLNGAIQDANKGEAVFQIGSNKDQNINLDVSAMDAESLGVAGTAFGGEVASGASNISSAEVENLDAAEINAGSTISISTADNTGATAEATVTSADLTITGGDVGEDYNDYTISVTDNTGESIDIDHDNKTISLNLDLSNTVSADISSLTKNVTGSAPSGGEFSFAGDASGLGTADAGTDLATTSGGADANADETIVTFSGASGSQDVIVDDSATTVTGTGDFEGLSFATSDVKTASGDISVTEETSSVATFNNGELTAEAVAAAGIDVSSQEAANNAIETIDSAIKNVSAERSKLGAYQNRLDHTINNLNTAEENLTAAESRISDVDMAKEMMNMSKQQILSQAGTAMMAQANQLPQGVLQLLG